MQILHALLVATAKNRENTSSHGSLSRVSVFQCPACCVACLEHTVCFFCWGLGVFSKLFWSRESTVHVWVTCRIFLHPCCAGVTVYKGELFPLWSVISCPTVIGQQIFSCVLVGWQPLPGSRPPTNCQHVTLFILRLKFHVRWRLFLECLPSFFASYTNLSSIHWLKITNESWGFFFAHTHTRTGFQVGMWIVISLVKAISHVYIQNG